MKSPPQKVSNNIYFLEFKCLGNQDKKIDIFVGEYILFRVGPCPIFWHLYFSYSQIRLHPKFRCPRTSGTALKVPGWVGCVGGTDQ